ncbi:MAG: hypothetical protein HYU35_00840 [Parcubacteria group bacterium]|nr:hypothetical protein [Parcubacteria group bacterium]
MESREKEYQEGYSPAQFLSKRIQKITEAAYRVSDLFPLEEPLRWSLRSAVLDVFRDFAVLEYIGEAERQRSITNAEMKIRRLLALIELASVGSFLSELNFAVLKREYSVFLSVIQEQQEILLPSQLRILEKPQFGSAQNQAEDFFRSEPVTVPGERKDKQEIKENEKDADNRNLYIGHSNGHSNGHSYIGLSDIDLGSPIKNRTGVSHGNLASNNFHSQLFDSLSEQPQEQQKQENFQRQESFQRVEGSYDYKKPNVIEHRKIPPLPAVGVVDETRKRQILELVKERGWVSVGDLASTFRGVVGEKTLQRDLLRMVDRGLLQKAGDKRWRRYALRGEL